MTRAVWKYDIPITDGDIEIDVPSLANGPLVPLSVGITRATPSQHLSVWVEANPGATPYRITLRVHGTGHYFDHDGQYISTVIDSRYGSDLVWHVYAQDVTL